MKKDLVRVGNLGGGNLPTLSAAQFGALAEVPAELEWLGNVENLKTRRAYRVDVREFMTFTGLTHPSELRAVARAHVIAWRDALKDRRLAAASIRRKLAALSSLFAYL